MKFQIKNCWTAAVQFECELEAKFETERHLVLNAAIKKAYSSGADLSGAILSGADLSGADLRDAVLRQFKSDLFDVLLRATGEIEGLSAALREGRVDGSVYEGECACLVGTIAKVRGCPYGEIPNLSPDSRRPAEQWFMSIRQGNTPENSSIVNLTLKWIAEFQKLLETARKVAA